MKLTKKLETEIKVLMEDYWQSYLKGDLDNWASFLVDDYQNIGTTQAEIWKSKKEIYDYTSSVLGQMVGLTEVRNKKTEIIAYDPYVMVHEFLDIYIRAEEEWTFYSNVRMSSLIQKIDNNWKILHQHGSYPDSKVMDGEFFAFDTLKSENLKLQKAIKKRTLELEKTNRKLEIEAALERVRTVAMSMSTSDDLLSICKVTFSELQNLGFDNLRNALINIPNDEEQYLIDYDYSELTGGEISKFKYGIHPIFEEYLKQIRGAEDALFQGVLGKDQLEGWKFLRKSVGQIDDPRLDETDALYYYLFSIGNGDIGISTFSQISESQIEILQRFRNVFSLAYKRYNDITLAEAQAKEAKVEAALEQVRSLALGMRKSEEVRNVTDRLFTELVNLSIDVNGASIVVIDEDTDKMELWRARSNFAVKPFESASFTELMDLLKKNVPDWFPTFKKALGKRKNYLIDEWTSDRRLQFINAIADQYKYSEEEKSQLLNNAPINITTHFIFFNLGYLALLAEKKLSTQNLSITRRFVEVFDFSYTRFLDLQNAESQARESKIEASLERVRTVAMSMMKSDELLKICESVFRELRQLGFNETDLRNTQIVINNDDKEIYNGYQYSDYIGGEIAEVPYDMHPIIKMLNDKLKQSTDAFADIEISGEAMDDWKAFIKSFPQKHDKKLNAASELHYYFYSVGIGALGISSFKPLSEEKLQILQRLRNVFNLSYQRYVDISKSEAQAREAQIELALERVRARTMGMQRSEELKEVIRIIYDQFVQLGINIEHTGFIVDYKTRDDMHIWLADQNEIPSEIVIPYFESPHWNSFNEAKANGKVFFANILSFEKKNKFYQDLFEYIPDVPEETKEYYFKCPGLAISTVLLENVGLYIENFSGIAYSDEENNTLMRFGKVFQQTYTRFLDLQKAEAQARQAQIETAMEKVRARALAMQKPEELIEVAQVLRKEMGLLGVEELETSSIYIHDEDSGTTECWYAIQDIREEDKKLLTDHMTMQLKDTSVGRKMMKFYRSDQNQTSILMQGDNRKEWINYCAEHSEALQGYYGDVIPERTYHLLKFSNGFMGAASPGEISAQSWELLERATSVFSFAYTRFRDLQQAEARAVEALRQASLDRVRAEIASMRSTDDLEKITPLIWRELTALGVPFFRCGVFIIDETNELVHAYLSTPEGNSLAALQIKIDKGVWVEKAVQNWRMGKMYYEVWDREKFLSWTQVMMDEGFVENKERFQDGKDAPENLSLQLLPFNQGMLYIGSEERLSEEEIELGQKLANDFGIAYSRYEDFQKLEEANNRKSVELEEARQLQLGMLPKETPNLTNLEIAAYMETATEVGGDYYDFNVDEDGSLTVVVGDATGHGMKAGTIVTITKSLFNSSGADSNILETFSKISKVIKDMKFRQLSMCLLMLKIKDYKLSISLAAMPPIFIYRSKTKTVDEILIKGMPLGAISNFPYSSEETKLQKGDNILLMSDGFPELMNGDGEIFGYERTRKLFGKIGNKKPNEIISKLNEAGKKWLNGRESDDDVTFVVMKVK